MRSQSPESTFLHPVKVSIKMLVRSLAVTVLHAAQLSAITFSVGVSQYMYIDSRYCK